jgi:hypothetical protein
VLQIPIPSPALGRGHLLERLPGIKLGVEHLDQFLPVGADPPQLRTRRTVPNSSRSIMRL